MPFTYNTIVWPLGVRPRVAQLDGDLFRDRELVLLRHLPIDEPDRLGLGADVSLDLHAERSSSYTARLRS